MAAAAATTCGQGSDCRNNAHLVMSIPERNSEEHLGAQVFHNSRSASVFENDNKEAQVTTSAAAKENEECHD